MCSLINKQLLLTAYAYLFITEQQKEQQGSEALQPVKNGQKKKEGDFSKYLKTDSEAEGSSSEQTITAEMEGGITKKEELERRYAELLEALLKQTKHFPRSQQSTWDGIVADAKKEWADAEKKRDDKTKEAQQEKILQRMDRKARLKEGLMNIPKEKLVVSPSEWSSFVDEVNAGNLALVREALLTKCKAKGVPRANKKNDPAKMQKYLHQQVRKDERADVMHEVVLQKWKHVDDRSLVAVQHWLMEAEKLQQAIFYVDFNAAIQQAKEIIDIEKVWEKCVSDEVFKRKVVRKIYEKKSGATLTEDMKKLTKKELTEAMEKPETKSQLMQLLDGNARLDKVIIMKNTENRERKTREQRKGANKAKKSISTSN